MIPNMYRTSYFRLLDVIDSPNFGYFAKFSKKFVLIFQDFATMINETYPGTIVKINPTCDASARTMTDRDTVFCPVQVRTGFMFCSPFSISFRDKAHSLTLISFVALACHN